MRSWLNSRPLQVLLLLACGALPGLFARAQEAPPGAEGMRLDLATGATCLTAQSLRERLVHWLQTWPADSSLRLEVHGSAHDPRTVVLRLHRRPTLDPANVTDQREMLIAERRFSPGPQRCGDLHDAVAIATALMVKATYSPTAALDPAAEEEPPAEPREPEPAASPDEKIIFSAPLPHEERPPPPPAAQRRPPPIIAKLSFVSAPRKRPPRGTPYLTGQAVFALDVGVSPGGGGKLAIGLPLGAGFEARLGGLALLSRMTPLEGTSGRYRTKMAAGAIDLCRRFPTDSIVEVRLCAGFLPGLLRANGFDFASPLGVSLFWPAISAELELALRLTKETSLRLSLAPVYALQEASLVARDIGGAVVGSADIPRLGVMFGIGIGYEVLRQGSTHSGHESL